jgi:hypothetical protein
LSVKLLHELEFVKEENGRIADFMGMMLTNAFCLKRSSLGVHCAAQLQNGSVLKNNTYKPYSKAL